MKVFEAVDDGGDVSVYATIEWAGSMKKTKPTKKANLNEHIYFHIPIEDDIKKD